jgi:hypothetical protein
MKIPFVPPITSRFVDAENFECALPDSVRAAILDAPKSPRIPTVDLPKSQPEKKWCWPFFWLLLGVAAALATLITWSTSLRKPVHGQVSEPAIIQHSNAAPRAILVRLSAPRTFHTTLPTAPRAQLIRLPEWRTGEQRQLLLPSGLKVLGRLRGTLGSTNALPATGELGDTWFVEGGEGTEDTMWVWLVAPGTTHAQWIDP